MPQGWLDFEQPLAELMERIDELTAIGAKEEVKRLREQVKELKSKLYSNLTPWQQVLLARHPRRPYMLDYIERMVTDFVELHGDRAFADDPAIIAGIGKINETGLAIIGHQKGRDTKEKLYRNFGMPHPEGYRKTLRVMKLAVRFGLPILSLIDTPAAYPGVGAEERGQAEAIARNLREMAILPVPIVVVVCGEGGSGGALAVAVGNRVLMQENALFSVISPEGCASILWRDGSKTKEAAEVLKMTASDLLKFGIIDEVVPEPLGGAHQDWDEAAKLLKRAVMANFRKLALKSAEELVKQRISKLASVGVYTR
ncbi:acetyl-CoA carboxylase carboxyl transferase subunit alpha [candidate division WOR-3 bacterium JGI_Cruoil_03_51_56]|uniref:Acetyl-coenzyme A carboxylase carboxyl transferase subunit alpha n=1 Tax=candidate division WOR-3 bacterium JGI_Cruoil_03_51_56 TaxID=1973747 RepID=A0A235BWF5_UNCW3|nr:MAG: acetyl-CoA carboxylase carboxyl transferase subunit alpha [candidate division WOR-3 bacterium JGI_Cruoil_03_51_56]